MERKQVVARLGLYYIGVRPAKKKDFEENRDQSGSRKSICRPKNIISVSPIRPEQKRRATICAQTHQVVEFFSIHIVHTGRDISCAVPKPKARRLWNVLLEVPGYQPREFALDPIHPNPLWYQVAPGKSVPLLSDA
jgi:hypothetical protein